MSGRLNSEGELLALTLLEDALEEGGADPASFIRAAGAYDRSVRERAMTLFKATGDAGGSLHTGGASSADLADADEALPDSIGGYGIVGVLGRGGMGTVYKARRKADFAHEVAIKVVKPGIATPGLKERFRRERQILAELRHPHIARLFDGGETEDGSPYIVMELVEGQSLARWLKKESPGRDRRLALFLQVCDAVEFAHQNLIIHRDLTPGNVLVTERDEAKLIDFGIARPQMADDSLNPQSPLSNLSLTPGFAAPERHTGAPANTLSDIYSLGKIMAQVIEPFVNPELSAIAAKASAEIPQDRYAGAALMAHDIRNFLAGRPVEAHSSSPTYRARKYVTRHRLPVALAGLAVFLLLAGLVSVSSAYRDAARERDNAERRFDEVRALSNFLLFDLYDELEDVPGTTKALNDIADEARHYLEVLSVSEGASSDVRLEAALAYKRLSDVLGAPIAQNLGRREEAGEMLDLAITQLRQLRSEKPDSEAIRRGLAEALYSQAVFAFISLDDNELAHEAGAESAALYWDLAEQFDPASYGARAIDAEIEAAQPLAWIGRGAEAVRMQSATLERMQAHIAKYGRSAENLGLLARTLITLSETIGRLTDSGQAEYADSLSYADRAVDAYREFVAASDKPDGARRSMAIALFKRALILYSMERMDRALTDLDEAEGIIGDLAARDVNDSGLSRTLAAIREQKAITLAVAGKEASAMTLARLSTAAKRAASQAEPDNPGLLREYASNLLLVGEVSAMVGRRSDACSAYREGAAVYERLNDLNGLSEFDRDVVMLDLPEALASNC